MEKFCVQRKNPQNTNKPWQFEKNDPHRSPISSGNRSWSICRPSWGCRLGTLFFSKKTLPRIKYSTDIIFFKYDKKLFLKKYLCFVQILNLRILTFKFKKSFVKIILLLLYRKMHYLPTVKDFPSKVRDQMPRIECSIKVQQAKQSAPTNSTAQRHFPLNTWSKHGYRLDAKACGITMYNV